MTIEPDAPSDGDRPVAALAGPFLHQRAAYRSPRPGGRIDELGSLDNSGDPDDDLDATTPDHTEEDDAR